MKKTFVLVVLFILPLVAYLFFASGINNFGKLPVLTAEVDEITEFKGDNQLQDRISILGFLGHNVQQKKGIIFNLNQKIYKPFYEFYDFQMVMVVPKGLENEIGEIRDELGTFTDIKKWYFIFGTDVQIRSLFSSLETDIQLDETLGTDYVFIVDKDRQLRGRNDDKEEGVKYGFDATSVAELNNKMEDDVKIILAEYRLALKKNKVNRNDP